MLICLVAMKLACYEDKEKGANGEWSKMQHHLTQSTTLRPGWGWYAAFGALAVIIATLGIHVSLRESSFIVPNLLAELFPIGMIVWFKTTALRIENSVIHYRSLFGKADIPVNDIISAKLKVGFSGYKPYQRLVVRARERSCEHEYILNLTLFIRDAIYEWLDIFRKHFPALES